MKFLFGIFAAIALSGCALFSNMSAADEWAKQQTAYNSTLELMIRYHAPCVEIGPDAPGCLINDEMALKLNQFKIAADGYLKAAKASLDAGDEGTAKYYLSSVTGSLAAMTAYLAAANVPVAVTE